MSKGGTGQKKAKEREVMQRIADATPTAPVELPEDVQRAHRANQVFLRCYSAIKARDRCLWPPQSLGALIAEQMFQELDHRLRLQLAEAQKIELPG